MIKNERQYQTTQEQLAQLEKSYREAEAALAARPEIPEVIRQAQLSGIDFLITDLKAELAQYQSLRAGKVRSLSLNAFLKELPAALIQARIAKGWNHKDLAKALGTSPQQVQKDEAGGYAKASLDKLGRVADALEITLTGQAKFR